MVHGHSFAMYKCDSCCSVAIWNCFSNRYCERCHNEASEPKDYPCPGPGLCPLGCDHPPNRSAIHCQGDEASFVIGCRACLGCMDEGDPDVNEGNKFGYPVRDWLSFRSAEQVVNRVGEEEIRSRFAARLDQLRTKLRCSDPGSLNLLEMSRWLLRVEQEEQRTLRSTTEQLGWRAEPFLEPVASPEDVEEAMLKDVEYLEARERSPLEDRQLAREARDSARSTRTLRRHQRLEHLAAKARRRAAAALEASPLPARRRCRRGDRADARGKLQLPLEQWLDLEHDGSVLW